MFGVKDLLDHDSIILCHLQQATNESTFKPINTTLQIVMCRNLEVSNERSQTHKNAYSYYPQSLKVTHLHSLCKYCAYGFLLLIKEMSNDNAAYLQGLCCLRHKTIYEI